MKLFVKLLDKTIPPPSYAHAGDAALDLRSSIDVTIPPRERRLVNTGISVAIPEGHAGLVWDRSGLAAKRGMHTLAGVIDSTYRGEICVVMMNLSDESFEIKKGDRIAQMLIQRAEAAEVVEVDELPPSERGAGGFGSTGLK